MRRHNRVLFIPSLQRQGTELRVLHSYQNTCRCPAVDDRDMNTTMHRWKFSALASALSLCTAFMASPAAALSLGAIHVQSHLGEPLRAEIDITQITAAEAGSLQATLASPDVFQAHGMELSPTARNVRVELISPAKGGSKIRLTTTSPVNDPFIDLILQANWSAGNLTRGYTLLLDPPPVQKPPAPTTAVQASTPAQTGQTYRSQPRTAAPSASSAAAATGTTDATSSVTVRTGDTAGRIAAAHAISGISLDQMLVAMLRNNPSAFINGNINRIKAGAVVSIPNAEQAQSTSAKEARRIIATQSKDFNAYRRKLAERTTQAQVGEAERSASGKVQAQVEDATAATTPTDKLTLSKGAAASKVEDKLMAEKQSTAQNDRTKELERNLAELEKLSDASAATTAAGSVAASAETAMPPTPGDNATAGDAPASPLTVEANAPVLPTDAGQPAPADPAPASTAAAAPDTPAEPAPPARKAAQKAPQPAPVPEPSLVDQLLENPLLPAGGVAVLGLLGLLAWRKRKQQAAAASAFNDSSLEVAPAPDSLFDSSGGQQIDTNSDTPASTMAYSPSQLDANGDVDPIAEADVYLAYGKEDEAIKILAEALRSAPDRLNIHIKLAEIYAKQQDLTQLEVTARAVKGLTQGQGSDWERVRTLGFNMDPYNSLYAEGTTTGAAAAAAATTTGFAQALAQSAETAAPTPSLESELLIPPSIQDDDSTDQFIASIDSSLNIEAPPSQPELPSQIQDTQFADSMLSPQEAVPSFDFSRVDLDLPSGTDSATTPATEANAAPAPAPAETLDFSLDSSFGFPTPAPAAETPAEEDDFGLSRLDFTDTPATFDTPAPPAAPATTPPDDDFGLGALDLPTAEAATAPPVVTDALPDFAADFGLDGLDLDPPSSPSTEAETTDSNDPLNTKLDLAQEFAMIGDSEGARTLIEEVLSEAQGTLKTRAQKMLNELE